MHITSFELNDIAIMYDIENGIFKAVELDDIQAFKWHLKNGFPIDQMDPVTRDTSLILACRLGRNKIAGKT